MKLELVRGSSASKKFFLLRYDERLIVFLRHTAWSYADLVGLGRL